MQDNTGNKVGRPSKYDPKYCQLLIDFMAKGFSIEAFCGEYDISKPTIYSWFKEHPEFLNAKRQATQKCRVFWEQKGIEGLFSTSESETLKDPDGSMISTSKSKSLNSAVWIFNMRNRFFWRDDPVEESEETQNAKDEQLLSRGITREEALKLLQEREEKKAAQKKSS